ncbi:MAG: iron-containing alcohol dehydrogenase [Candidatus Bathyarchaeia archaeon]
MRFINFSVKMLAGFGSLSEVTSLCKHVSFGRKVALLTGKTTHEVAGKRVQEILSREGFDVAAYYTGAKAQLKDAQKLLEGMKADGRTDGLIAVGGGKVIDTAKFIAAGANMPLAVVPTNLSSDAIASPWSVLWEGDKSTAHRTVAPSGIIGDYDILKNQPAHFVAAGIGDYIAKVSCLYDWRLAYFLKGETYSGVAARIAKSNLAMVFKHIRLIKERHRLGLEVFFHNLVQDGYLMELANTTRVAGGSEHLFCFALTDLTGKGLHGELCGVGTVMMTFLQGRDWRRVREVLREVDGPVDAQGLGVKADDIVKALMKAHTMRSWYTILGEEDMSEDAADRLGRHTGVID